MTTLWKADFENGLSPFENTSWNDLPAAPDDVTDPIAPVPVPNPVVNHVGQYFIPAGGQRCENVPNVREFVERDDLWFTWRTLLGPDFLLNTSEWQVLCQWKNDGIGSPPVELTVSNGQYRLDGGWGWPGNTNDTSRQRLSGINLGPAKTGVWERWQFHIKFSSDPAQALVEAYRNGNTVALWRPKGGTLYPNLNSYLKIGYYRSSKINQGSTVYHDDWRVDDTRPA
jgi:hypothetical protein